MTEGERIRVLIVDDHPVVRAGLRGMLAGNPRIEIAGEAGDGDEALATIRRTKPTVVLLDLRMPRLGGVGVLDALAGKLDKPSVVVLTTYDADADILRAIEAGAAGYLLKDTPREQIFEAIEAAARGQTWLAPSVATRLVRQMQAPVEGTLSAREVEVLTHASRGASNKEIALALAISEATVKSHLVRIYRRLGVPDRTAAVTVAIERGLIRLDGPGRADDRR